MALEIAFIDVEDRLDLTVQGRLDLTLTSAFTDLLRVLPRNLRTCILDLTRVGRIFDSGLALLWLLGDRLQRRGVTVVVLAIEPRLLQQLPRVMKHASLTIPLDASVPLEPGRMRARRSGALSPSSRIGPAPASSFEPLAATAARGRAACAEPSRVDGSAR